MAILTDQGVHCSVRECGQKDFLPFTCDQCEQVFCLDHFRYAAHSCVKAGGLDNRVLVCPLCQKSVKMVPDEDPTVTWERHLLSECEAPHGRKPVQKARCPVQGCKEKLTFSNSLECKTCGQKVCLKHRFEDDHPCQIAPRSAKAPAVATRKPAPQPQTAWTCGRCTLQNAASAGECVACGVDRPASTVGVAPVQAVTGRSAVPSVARRLWTCKKCTLDNDAANVHCVACGAEQPKCADSGCNIS